jgi:predicted dehydrogenase
VLSCRTDSFGGPEGVASIVLQRGACTITVALSWLSKLSNRYKLVGTGGVIEGGTTDAWGFTVAGDRGRRRQVEVGTARGDYRALFRPFVDNFLDAIRGHTVPLVPGTAALPSIQLMDECYRSASRMSMPWLETLPDLHVQAY